MVDPLGGGVTRSGGNSVLSEALGVVGVGSGDPARGDSRPDTDEIGESSGCEALETEYELYDHRKAILNTSEEPLHHL